MIRLGSKKDMIIVKVSDKTSMIFPPLGKGSKHKQIIRHKTFVGMPTYKTTKKMVANIEKELTIKLPLSLVRKSASGVFPPIGIMIDDKIVKVIKPYGKK